MVSSMIFIATVSCTVALGISIFTIVTHLRNFTIPRYQLFIVRILLMVPIYAFQSWLSLTLPKYALFFDTIRDSYEAWVIYMFFSLLIAVLGGEELLADYLTCQPRMKQPFPVSALPCKMCSQPMKLGPEFLSRVKQGTLQFVLIKPLTAVVAMFLQTIGKYDEGKFSPSCGFFWLALINNVSVSIALYSLVLFFLAVGGSSGKLDGFRPLPKFLCIKAVVFFSFWQSLALSVLVWLGFIETKHNAKYLQDFIICIECTGFAIAHHFAFSAGDFIHDEHDRKPLLTNIKRVLDVKDVIADVDRTFIANAPPTPEEMWSADSPRKMKGKKSKKERKGKKKKKKAYDPAAYAFDDEL